MPRIDNSTFGALDASDISSHLSLIYFLVHLSKPRNVVELGTRDGQSTRALRHAVEELGILGISVDLSPAPADSFGQHPSWKHFEDDDLSFAKKLQDKKFRNSTLGAESIDFLFVDTSHEYLHTLGELESYWPLLSERSVVVLHDTNLSTSRKMDIDGRVYRGWDNSRGVTRALEEFLYLPIDEKSVFSKTFEGNTYLHLPWGNGILVILKFADKN